MTNSEHYAEAESARCRMRFATVEAIYHEAMGRSRKEADGTIRFRPVIARGSVSKAIGSAQALRRTAYEVQATQMALSLFELRSRPSSHLAVSVG